MIVGEKLGLGYVIKEMYAFLWQADDGDESVPSVLTGDTWVPLMGADMRRIDSLRHVAKQLAKESGSRFAS